MAPKHPVPGVEQKPMLTKRQLIEALEADDSELDEPISIYVNDGGLQSYWTLSAVEQCLNSNPTDPPGGSFMSLVLEAGEVRSVG